MDVHSNADWNWNCEGLKTATQVYGTLNCSCDKDEGWTVEIAVPWSALKPLTKGAPKPGSEKNKWTAHLGHVYKGEFEYKKRRKSKHQYATWPTLDVRNCHVPEQWGELVFETEDGEQEAQEKGKK
jgi:hypothetical protein